MMSRFKELTEERGWKRIVVREKPVRRGFAAVSSEGLRW